MRTSDLLDPHQFELLKKGDQLVFKQVYNQYFGLVHYVVKRCGLNEEQSRDVVQDTFLRLFNNAADLQSAMAIKSWLVTTGRNLAIDLLRKYKVEKKYIEKITIESEVTEDPNLISSGLLNKLEIELLGDLLDTIEQETNDDTLTLFYQQGLSAKQIAERKGEPISTVTNRLSRSRNKFRQCIEAQINKLRDDAY